MRLKALINKEKNKVVFAECNANLVDVLFSFLTMPMGTIVKLTRNKQSSATIGSMNNLYNSVEFLDLKYFRTKQCKAMLLCPKGSADDRIKNIGVALGNDEAYDLFICQKSGCSQNLVSHYKDAYCRCGKIMDGDQKLLGLESEDEEGGLFVKGLSRYIISDDLQVAPLSTAATFSLLSEQGVKNGCSTEMEEKKFGIGKNEILALLESLLVSKTPLTEILLKNCKVKGPDQECFGGITLKQTKIKSSWEECDGNICVKLIVSKTSERVYYAEASEDFIDLLFSFLTIPLGNVAKAMEGSSSKECAHNMYPSVLSLDATAYLISEEVKLSLLFPTIQRHFGIKKQPIGFKEFGGNCIDEMKGSTPIRQLIYLDPKSRDNKRETESSSGGYVKGHTMFTVTDNLVIKPISALSALSILKEFDISFSDVEERIVHVGKEEAARLLVASLISIN